VRENLSDEARRAARSQRVRCALRDYIDGRLDRAQVHVYLNDAYDRSELNRTLNEIDATDEVGDGA